MRWLKYIFSYSIFISICAVALCYQASLLAGTSPRADLYAFVFFSTLGSYNFYWLLSKFSFSQGFQPSVFVTRNAGNLIFLFIALSGMLWFGLKLTEFWIPIAVATALTLVYSIPLWPIPAARLARKAGILKPVTLALTWTFVTVIFPTYEYLESHTVIITLVFITRFFFMMMLCMIFDMRDSSVDQSRAFHSLATDVSPARLKIIMSFLFIFYVAAGLVSRYILHNKLQVISFILTGVAVWMVYRLSLRKQGYFFYYFIVDGLMLLSPVFTWLATL